MSKKWEEITNTVDRVRRAQRRAYVRRHMPKAGDQDYEAMAEEMKKLGYFAEGTSLREVRCSIKAHIIQIEQEDLAEVELNDALKKIRKK